jgi:hypothetical protein
LSTAGGGECGEFGGELALGLVAQERAGLGEPSTNVLVGQREGPTGPVARGDGLVEAKTVFEEVIET